MNEALVTRAGLKDLQTTRLEAFLGRKSVRNKGHSVGHRGNDVNSERKYPFTGNGRMRRSTVTME